MTRLDTVARPNRPQFLVPPSPKREPDVRAMLREIAYVLHCTRKVKAEILAEREERRLKMLPPSATAV
jgi:hypothetical protein